MTLRHAVLGLLAESPGSGYDLLKRFESAMGLVWTATQSQLYGELGKLEKSSLIEVAAEGPRGRKEYAITPSGREVLRSWLLEERPVAPRRNEMLLRVYFLGEVSPEQARGFLTANAESARGLGEELARVEQAVDWDDSDASVFGRLALEWGKRYAAMEREWAEWAAEVVRSERG
ncbi:PadR family transcriptional regulator [Amycolatopsis benzoatilytica]|uniref:PadR family transcriptional regulator n=1 Tax=Amycolatopsis benzoatilytica TaxID=346045 RepID=UPI000372AE00|nr:PadR family transcriptional regulator [Amycolatopsis benzoatilytica]